MYRSPLNSLDCSPEDRIELAIADDYEASDRFADDAWEWACDARPDAVWWLVADLYRQSSAFATRIDDALNGERAW